MARVSNATQAIQTTTNILNGGIASLSARKTKALSAFRQTANELAAVNAELEKSLSALDSLRTFVAEQTDAANKMIADNSAIRTKILDIIGE